MDYLGELATMTGSFLIVLTETWLQPDVLDAEVSIPGYKLYRQDRVGISHGGVCMFIREDISAQVILSTSKQSVESLMVKSKGLKSIYFVVYRPGKVEGSGFTETMAEIGEEIDLCQANGQYPMINGYGDYNFPDQKWESSATPSSLSSSSVEAIQFNALVDLMNRHLLTQIIRDSTRVNNILDLILVNREDVVSSYEIMVNESLSDHNTIMVKTKIYPGVKKSAIPNKDYYDTDLYKYDMNWNQENEANWLKYEDLMNKCDWTSPAEINNNLNILNPEMRDKGRIEDDLSNEKTLGDKFMSHLTNNIVNCAHQAFNLKKEKRKGNLINWKVRKMMREKKRISRRIFKCREAKKVSSLREDLKKVEEDIKNNYDRMRLSKEMKILPKIKEDPATFYSYARSFAETRTEIGPLINDKGDLTQDESEMASLLANQYMRMWSTPSTTIKREDLQEYFKIDDELQNTDNDKDQEENDDNDNLGHQENNQQLNDIEITLGRLEEALNLLSNKASPGPDGIPTTCLKYGGMGLKLYLIDFLRQSLDDTDVPLELRRGLISPIYKGGPADQCKNYRPISLTGHLSKLFERIIRPQIVEYLERGGLMDKGQHGCRPGRSTLTQLLYQHDAVLNMLLNGYNVDIIYLDFEKAFNKVDLGLLLAKIRSLGIGGKLGAWLGAFIMDRVQAVRVGSKISSWQKVKSGVPQGSVLGPLLFLIFISDLGEDEEKEEANEDDMEKESINENDAVVLKFVDDTKIIKGVKEPKDVEDLQSVLDEMYRWQEVNNMAFNGSKFQLVRIGPDQDLKENTLLFTNGMRDVLEVSNEVKDLGIIVDIKADFKPQRQRVIEKARGKANWILRTFTARTKEVMMTLWGSLVQPHLDYCNQVWGPSSVNAKEDIRNIEQIFRAYSRKINGCRTKSYWERLKDLRSYSSQRRMERYRIIYTWKAINGLVPYFGLETQDDGRRGRTVIIPQIRGIRQRYKSLYEGSFRIDGAKLFNSIPRNLRDYIGTKETFKRNLDKFLETVPDQPYLDKYQVPEALDYMVQPSNSLYDWIRTKHLQDYEPDEMAQRPIQEINV